MSTVVASITYVDSPPVDASTVVANQLLTVVQPDGTSVQQQVPVGATSASLVVTQVGNYSASLEALDQNGNAIGSAATGSFAVAAPAQITVKIPGSLSFSVSP